MVAVSEQAKENQRQGVARWHAANRAREELPPRPARKTCSKCKVEKDGTDFNVQRSTKSGLSGLCKGCDHDQARRQRWIRKYGITPERYEELLAEQNGGCAICGQACSTGQFLSVDHDHVTGEVRGLLCRQHNRALGLFDDDPELLRISRDYLLRYRKPQPIISP